MLLPEAWKQALISSVSICANPGLGLTPPFKVQIHARQALWPANADSVSPAVWQIDVDSVSPAGTICYCVFFANNTADVIVTVCGILCSTWRVDAALSYLQYPDISTPSGIVRSLDSAKEY